MNFDGEYLRIGSADTQAIRAAIEALPESVWFEEIGRQQVYKAHAHTQTIPLIFDPDMRHTNMTVQPAFAQFQTFLQPVMEQIVAHFAANPPNGESRPDKGYFARIILVRLSGQSSIGSHRDHGHSLSRAHRIHFPIITNDKAVFGIAGVIRHLAAGEIWEINNRKAHAVRNESDQARIHAIFDYVLPGEVVADPDGLLVA